jgi:hypothetical protein
MEKYIMEGSRTYTPRPQSRAQKLLSWMLNGNAITGRSALKKFGIYRLSANIHNWRKAGYTIDTTMRKRHGQIFASYKITSTPNV